MRVDANRIEELAEQGWADSVTTIIEAAGANPIDDEPPRSDDWGDVTTWWLEQMVAESSGLHERLSWFWHTLLTTNAHKVSDSSLIRDQLIAIRADATTDYRSLLHGYVTSGALLEYLDASWSMASNPNENLGRELMELFTLGRGNYTEDDVRAAARALSGWVVEDGKVEWRRQNAFVAPLLFRGVQDEWDTTKIVDHLCDQPETATNVASKLWTDLVGRPPDPITADELGAWWQEQELDILSLTERILIDGLETAPRLGRPRTGLEWFTAFHSVAGTVPEDPWRLEALGQLPYLPPNVGGWPDGDRWLAPGSVLGRLSMAVDVDPSTMAPGRSGTTDEILDRCGLYDVSPSTIEAIDTTRSSDEVSAEAAGLTRWRLALSSPEFNLS